MAKRKIDLPPEYYRIEMLHDYSVDPENREIYVSGEPSSIENQYDVEPGVEFIMADRFVKNIRFLALQSNKPILAHLKTCGGNWQEGMAMYDAIKLCPCNVTVLSYTHARSMSSIILQAADWRVLMPNSYFLFHYGTEFLSGDVPSVLSQAEHAKHDVKVMLDIYVERAKKGAAFKGMIDTEIRRVFKTEMEKKTDVYLTSEQAIKWGLADEVFSGDWENLKSWER